MVRGLRSARYKNFLIEDLVSILDEQHFGEGGYTEGGWRIRVKKFEVKSGTCWDKVYNFNS